MSLEVIIESSLRPLPRASGITQKIHQEKEKGGKGI
jgi:hypothetical protein